MWYLLFSNKSKKIETKLDLCVCERERERERERQRQTEIDRDRAISNGRRAEAGLRAEPWFQVEERHEDRGARRVQKQREAG